MNVLHGTIFKTEPFKYLYDKEDSDYFLASLNGMILQFLKLIATVVNICTSFVPIMLRTLLHIIILILMIILLNRYDYYLPHVSS